jgi:phosphopantetheinyl transferase (holo-ACP synthase)
MISAGNDIVALSRVNKQRASQPRFYSKILSASEHELYHKPEFKQIPFENYLWLLWSVKESAYKYLKRMQPELVFSPTKIIITSIDIPVNQLSSPDYNEWENISCNDEFYTGKVAYGSDNLYFRSKITNEFIVTVVNDSDDFDDVCWGIRSIDDCGYDHQSKAARAFLLTKLNALFPGNLTVEKSAIGYPVIVRDMENMNIPVSLAHDGCLVAYSIRVNHLNNN